VVNQPDSPAGSEADDEPTGPANGADPAPSPELVPFTWPAATAQFGRPPAAPAESFQQYPAGPPAPPLSGAAPPLSGAGQPLSGAAQPPAGPGQPYGTGGQPPAGPGQLPGRPRRAPSLRLWLTIAAALLGVAGLIIGLDGVAAQVLPRTFTAAEQQRITSWEVASRWRTWPAGKIFPATVGYQISALPFGSAGLRPTARRVGIAAESGCPSAVDPALARVLDKRGCEGVLRATYTDSTGSFVVTVGVVVMRGAAPAARSLPAGHGVPPGLRPVPFAHTLAARFGPRQRQLSGAASYGPYLALFTAGYADARQRVRGLANPYDTGEMQDFGLGLTHSVGRALGAPPPAPRCPGAPGC
jgi:hypothetical protein